MNVDKINTNLKKRFILVEEKGKNYKLKGNKINVEEKQFWLVS